MESIPGVCSKGFSPAGSGTAGASEWVMALISKIRICESMLLENTDEREEGGMLS